jgi:hypothetical protein
MMAEEPTRVPEEATSVGGQRPVEPFDRRIEQLERENRWWRGDLIAALVFIGLMLLAGGRHRRRIDVVVTVPPWALRMPYWGYGPVPYSSPPRGWGGFGGGSGRPRPEVPGGGPNPQGPQSPPE